MRYVEGPDSSLLRVHDLTRRAKVRRVRALEKTLAAAAKTPQTEADTEKVRKKGLVATLRGRKARGRESAPP